MESKTNCKKVCATQETITIVSPDCRALGNEIRATPANKYAHHMVATPAVIFWANQRLNLFTPSTIHLYNYAVI